ncbi:MAG TPA: VWA domain-containing protein [Saprospiraceae bacterium]|nr:VWA domain-containing protein [Saprospiraceae bacterium]
MNSGVPFADPYWLLLLWVIPVMIYWHAWKGKKAEVHIGMPDLKRLYFYRGWRARLDPVLTILKYLSLAALIVAMARPQKTLKEETVKAEGIDIFLVMDLSSSMLAKDFNPDRLEVSKRVAIEFVEKRPYDRIGLAVFAGESFTQCPLTTDHRVVKDFLASLQCGVLQDGTAIGMGLAAGVNRLKDSDARSKVIILLTDGVNNAGYIQPLTAAEVAKEFDVRVYTIGIGTRGDALAPMSRREDGRYVFGMTRVEIDEGLMKEIAMMTGGQYFRATSAESLERIYAEIDRLEKTEMEVSVFNRYSEEYYKWLIAGMIGLGLYFILKWTVLRRIPS